MSSDKKDQLQIYINDSRIPCQYGYICYQKNPQHLRKYKHPPKTETARQNKKVFTGVKRKSPIKDDKVEASVSSERKLQKTCESSNINLHNLSPSLQSKDISNDKDDNKNHNVKTEVSNKDVTNVETTESNCSSSVSNEHNKNRNISVSEVDAQKIITELFLVEMPKDFFQFYDFCKDISKSDPLLAFKSVGLKLVGPYDVLSGKIKSSGNENDKEKYLVHWRYYYDPPEFQTIIQCNNKTGLHFGYWRDDVREKPVFVAKNSANINCIFESLAENIFGAVDAYLQSKLTLANPFEKVSIVRLHSQLKKFAKEHDITLAKNTTDMQCRERKVVARTFHKVGIVVSYEKKIDLGYRNLSVTDNDLQEILKQIEKAPTTDEGKKSIIRLDEIIRLTTIAADECDFGTCLELGHDLFSNGGISVQSKALQMLTIAYTYLHRPQLLKIFEAHLKNRRRGCELSVI